MPVYNAAEHLISAVDSILNQTCEGLEFHIFDDGSNDGSRTILERYACSDARIKLHLETHAGYAVWLQRGIELARAPLLARMDADDVARPTRLQMQMDHLARHPDHVAVGCWVQMIDADSDPIAERQLPVDHEGIDGWHMAGRGGAIMHPTLMVRRQAMRDIGGYRAEFEPAEDFDLFLRLAEIGQLANIPEVLLDYRMHLKSVTFTRRQLQVASKVRALTEATQRRGVPLSHRLDDELHANTPATDGSWLRQHWIELATTAGHHQTALKHAWRAVRASPRSTSAWRALAMACDATPAAAELSALPPILRCRSGRTLVSRTANCMVGAVNLGQDFRQLLLRTPVMWRCVK